MRTMLNNGSLWPFYSQSFADFSFEIIILCTLNNVTFNWFVKSLSSWLWTRPTMEEDMLMTQPQVHAEKRVSTHKQDPEYVCCIQFSNVVFSPVCIAEKQLTYTAVHFGVIMTAPHPLWSLHPPPSLFCRSWKGRPFRVQVNIIIWVGAGVFDVAQSMTLMQTRTSTTI